MIDSWAQSDSTHPGPSKNARAYSEYFVPGPAKAVSWLGLVICSTVKMQRQYTNAHLLELMVSLNLSDPSPLDDHAEYSLQKKFTHMIFSIINVYF